ncbi:nitrilase-related carbon-nitrogen hydrolase, partial [Pseudomonas sp. RIT-To-2]|uniref:nitrilase-related carbon-nitrogen hydrolase n=1 Tax=Pseudomonas sp. RIT-To-2 TaxID=3462541 RepID=UPI0024131A1C
MNNLLNVAAVQFEPTLFEKPRNLDRLSEWVEEAARAGAQLIVTPEMGTTGYCWQDREEVAPYVETIPGPTTERFARLARQYGCHIVIGMPEVDPVDDLYYNAAVLIGPQGVVGKHRKTHPYISEPKWAASGDLGHQVFDTPIGRIALLICMDIHFLETARVAGLGGADVICHVSNWLAERTPAPYWINRAFENGCYLVESNRWGQERGVQFSGGTCVIEPDGHVQGILDKGDGLLFGKLDLARVRDRQPTLMAARRPALYKELAQPAYAWNPLDFFGLYGLSPRARGKVSAVAVGQFAPGRDTAANLRAITEQAQAAKAQGAELVVFPELSLSGGYVDDTSALAVDGPEVRALLNLAIELRVHLVA